jgi:hypothetical protein
MRYVLVIILAASGCFSQSSTFAGPGTIAGPGTVAGGANTSGITYVNQTLPYHNTSTNTATSASTNMTGANFFITAAMTFDSTALTCGDSVGGNSWQYATNYSNVTLCYAINATASGTQTFTCKSNFVGCITYGFTFPDTNGAIDQQCGLGPGSGTSIQPSASCTPTVNNELIFTAIGLTATSTTPSVSGTGSFSTPGFLNFSSGTNYGVAAAYQIQTTKTAEQPTWSFSNQGGFATVSVTLQTFEP